MPLIPKQQPPYYEPMGQIKTLKAYLSQLGATDAPISNTLTNTIGEFQLSRTATGVYKLIKEDAFPDYTKIILNPAWNPSVAGIASATPFEYAYSLTWTDADTITIEVFKSSDYSYAELYDVTNQIYIEIIVYP